MENHELELLERGVLAIERLAADPEIHIEAGPPVCPHCEKFNPEISTQEDSGRGLMFEYVVVAKCMNCGNTFYGIPQMWVVAKNQEEAQAELQERAGVNGNRSA